jgi:hypothetical protein
LLEDSSQLAKFSLHFEELTLQQRSKDGHAAPGVSRFVENSVDLRLVGTQMRLTLQKPFALRKGLLQAFVGRWGPRVWRLIAFVEILLHAFSRFFVLSSCLEYRPDGDETYQSDSPMAATIAF